MSDETSTLSDLLLFEHDTAPRHLAPKLALVLAWSAAEPERSGEVALVSLAEGQCVLGRGAAPSTEPRARMVQQRPGVTAPMPPLAGAGLSRRQLRIIAAGQRLRLERIGKCPLLVNGQTTDQADVCPGDTVLLKNQLLFLCVERPEILPPLRDFPERELSGFGLPDRTGLVGESVSAWQLREELAFVAQSEAHVLLLGASGTGKEVAAHALHRLSAQSRRPMVSRNAATFPSELVDAELFGNVRGYPNPGMKERSGLIGEADGGTLFLDEVGELPPLLQAHLLRVMDQGGEYQRLGESVVRSSRFRMIAATNREVDQLKADFAARFALRLAIPSLSQRRDDIPLLMNHLLQRKAGQDARLVNRFFANDKSGRSLPRVSPLLLEALLRHEYTLHLRELDALLWTSMQTSQGNYLDLTPEVEARLTFPRAAAAAPDVPLQAPVAESDPPAPVGKEARERAAIVEALERTQGNLARASRELGLPSRYALYRLLRKHHLPYR